MSDIEPWDISNYYFGVAGTTAGFIKENLKGNKSEFPEGIQQGVEHFLGYVKNGLQGSNVMSSMVHCRLAIDAVERLEGLKNPKEILEKIINSMPYVFKGDLDSIDAKLVSDFFDSVRNASWFSGKYLIPV